MYMNILDIVRLMHTIQCFSSSSVCLLHFVVNKDYKDYINFRKHNGFNI